MITEQQKTNERLKLRGENVLLQSENRKLKNIVKNIKMYLEEKMNVFTYFETQSLSEQIALIREEAKYKAYSDILKYIKEKGY